MIAPALWLLLSCGGEPVEVRTTEAELQSDAPPGRSWRRMNIDQLRASLLVVTGGIGWTEQQDGEAVELFEALDATLGKPDYISASEEDLAPGLLFQKFLDDAAQSVCAELVDVEPTRAGAERTLLVHVTLEDTPGSAPDAVSQNLAAALLRFHGRPLSPGDPGLEPWEDLVALVYARTGDMGLAWRATCVALITHPDFYTY